MDNTCDKCNNYSEKSIVTQTVITCPNCGFKKNEIMPLDACVYYYECEKCKVLLKPLPGDCCVYCSFGTVKCPPVQASQI